MSKLFSVVYASGCLMALFMSGVSYADDAVEVMSVEGSVMTGDTLENAKQPVKSRGILPGTNVLVTGHHARAVLRVGTDGIIVVGENSRIEIQKPKDHAGFFRQVTGMIYYALNTVIGKRDPIQIRTATATIGVRGTRFLVTDTEGRNEIGMRKGLVSVTSPEGEFEIHKKAEQDEFDAFKREAADAIAKEKKEFEEYKTNQQKEFIEFKKEFSLSENRMATFEGKRVVDRPLSEETKKDMGSFESYADEWLKDVHD